MMPVRVLAVAAVLSAATTLFGEKVDGEPGAIFRLRDSKIKFQAIVDVPGRRMASLTGDMFPNPANSTWSFRLGMSPNGIDPDISGSLKTSFDESGAMNCTYRFVCGKDCNLYDMFISGFFPNDLLAGGRIVADGGRKSADLDVVFKGRGGILHGDFSKLEFIDAKGVCRLTVTYRKPQKIAVRDARSWGRSGFGLYQYLLEHAAVKKGEVFELPFTISAPEPLEPAFERRVVKRGPDWIPAVFDKEILSGSACDFSKLTGIDAPAGRHGWIVPKGENFEFEKLPGKRQRFYGNNICWTLPMMSRERCRKLARELVKNGYNSVRLHYWDIMAVDGVNDGTTIPEKRLAGFDGFMKEMIDAGIYVSTDLFTSRRIPYRSIGMDRDGFASMAEIKQLLLFHEPTVSNLEAYVKQILTHVNPYTGRDYAHEPALAWYCLVNEGNAGNFKPDEMAKLPGCKELWSRWISEKKASDPLYAKVSEEFPRSFREKDLNGAAARQFLRYIETRFDARMKAFVRSLGSKALVSSMNHWCNPPGYQLIREDVYDYVDDHFYIDHPNFIGKNRGYPTRCKALNPVADGYAGVPHVISRRLLDKPFTITEYNYSAPGRFRGAGGILMGSFASLQNWAAIWRFCFGRQEERVEDPNPYRITFHDTWSDPIMRASEYVFAALYLRGDIPQLERRMPITLSRKRLETLHVEPVDTAFHIPWAPLAWYSRLGTLVSETKDPSAMFDISYEDAYTMSLDKAKPKAFPGLPADAPLPPAADGAVRFDVNAGTFAVATPRTCGTFTEKGVMSAGGLSTDIGDVPATVWAVSLDGAPLESSTRILFAHLTDVQDEGTVFIGDGVSCLLKWGEPPHLMQRGTAKISLSVDDGEYEVWALSSGGRRIAKVPVHRDGGALSFVANTARDGNSATWLYEAVRINVK
jgi:hypothetical protein